jgi:hypothetical protein
MLIVPISGKIGWKNPPLVTLALLIVNCLVFFLFQTGDDQARMEAETYYMESGLATIEVPRYDDYRARRDTDDGSVHPTDMADAEAVFARHLELEGDADFLRLLAADRVVTPDEPDYEHWRMLRRDYEARCNRSVAFAHGLRPAFPRPASFFT